MIFNQATEELLLGKKIRRFSWDKESYIQLDDLGTPKFYKLDISQFQYDQTIILSEGWLIRGADPDKSYNWISALEALKMGAEIYLPHWKEMWLILEKNDCELVMKQYIESPFTPTFIDFTSTDWEAS